MYHIRSGHPERKQTAVIRPHFLHNFTPARSKEPARAHSIDRQPKMLLPFWKQFTDQILFSGKKTADIVNKRLGIGFQYKTSRVGDMFLNPFLFDLGKWEAKLFLAGHDTATGRSLKRTPSANIGIVGMVHGHNGLLPGYPASPL